MCRVDVPGFQPQGNFCPNCGRCLGCGGCGPVYPPVYPQGPWWGIYPPGPTPTYSYGTGANTDPSQP